jgi:hypothetical protein
MSIAASEGGSDFSANGDSVPMPPSCVAAVLESDPEMMAMLSRAANRIGLVWNPPPCPESSRLDDWYLGVARAGSQQPTLSSRRCMKSSLGRGRHLLLPETVPVAPPSPPLMAGQLRFTCASHWSGPLLCNCAQLHLAQRVESVSLPGPVSTCRTTRHGVVAGPSGQGTEGPAQGWS